MATYTYETKFWLTNPVNDFNAAYDYLQEDSMVTYLKDEMEYKKIPQEYIDAVEDIEWILRTDASGKIVLTANKELPPFVLNMISNWVSGQNSDGLGEGFEQQPFAEIYDEDEYGDPIEDTYDMASFDWQTNDYKFELKTKSPAGSEGALKDSVIRESVEKCCETCKYYIYDHSTGLSECNGPDDAEWVKQESDNYWRPDYDYCDKYEEAPYEEGKILESDDAVENSVLVNHFAFDEELDPDSYNATKKWLQSLNLSGILKCIREFPQNQIKKAEISKVSPEGFDFKIFTTRDLVQTPNRLISDLSMAVDRYVFSDIENVWQSMGCGQLHRKRHMYLKPNLQDFVSESKSAHTVFSELALEHIRSKRSKALTEGLTEPTERSPLLIDAPRGPYYIWVDGGSIYGSVDKPDPTKNVVDARATVDFTGQGFDDLDEVIAYVKKYF